MQHRVRIGGSQHSGDRFGPRTERGPQIGQFPLRRDVVLPLPVRWRTNRCGLLPSGTWPNSIAGPSTSPARSGSMAAVGHAAPRRVADVAIGQ